MTAPRQYKLIIDDTNKKGVGTRYLYKIYIYIY